LSSVYHITLGFPASETTDVLIMVQALSLRGVDSQGELSLLVPLDKTIRNGYRGLPAWAMPGADLDESKENIVPIGRIRLEYFVGRKCAMFVFTGHTRDVGGLFQESVSVRATFARILEDNNGLFGIFSMDEGKGEMFWCLGRKTNETVLYMPQYREPDELADRILLGRAEGAQRAPVA
jgi:hypothetical protein